MKKSFFFVFPAFLLLLTAAGCREETAGAEEIDVSIEPDIEKAAADLPEEIRELIEKNRDYFFTLLSAFLKGPEDYYVLVDKSHPLPASSYPEDLVPLDEFPFVLNKEGLTLRRTVIPDLLAMVKDARAEGIELPISSTFRSYEYQEGVFRYNVEQLGEEQAKRESAEPGKSQHQLGTTVDFGSITAAFAETAAGRWLKQHAWKYGFSLSYPENFEHRTGYMHESWHYRYIGRTGTRLEAEFFLGIQQYMLEFIHRIKENGAPVSGR